MVAGNCFQLPGHGCLMCFGTIQNCVLRSSSAMTGQVRDLSVSYSSPCSRTELVSNASSGASLRSEMDAHAHLLDPVINLHQLCACVTGVGGTVEAD